MNILEVFASSEGGRLWPDGDVLMSALVHGKADSANVKQLLASCDDEIFRRLSERVLAPLVEIVLGKARGEEQVSVSEEWQ